MKPQPFFLAWLVTATALFVLNGIFHGVVAASFFDTQLSVLGNAVVKMKDFKPIPIVILELVLDFCLVIIITRDRNEKVVMKEAVLIGGLFYLSTAITWSLANAATLVAWPAIVTMVDGIWHFTTGMFAGWIIAKLYNLQFRVK